MKQDHYVEQNFAQNPICYKQLVNRCNLCIMFRPSWHFVSWKNANEVFTASFPPERNVTCKTINPDRSRFDLNISSDSRWLIQQWSIRIRHLSYNLPVFLSFFFLSLKQRNIARSHLSSKNPLMKGRFSCQKDILSASASENRLFSTEQLHFYRILTHLKPKRIKKSHKNTKF